MADLQKTGPSTATASQRTVIDPALRDDLMERVLAPENLRKAWHQVKANHGAPGVDGMTIEDFPAFAREHWPRIRQAIRDETYQPAPVRRREIPKRHGKGTRLLGIPTVVDRIIQQAIAQVLGPLFDPKFSASSFGFRPGRSAHQAVKQIQGSIKAGYRVAVDLDLAKFFDTLAHQHLRGFLDRRVRDGVIRRMIDKWLKAGVLEQGSITHPEAGTPQGSGISPLLMNVYMHHVLDLWFEQVVKPRCEGAVVLYRFADDAVILCASERDAQRIIQVLPKRCAKYGLQLHPDKTRVICFTRPPYASQGPCHPQADWPGTFEFLGFIHYWGRSRQGNWVVKRKTAAARFTRSITRIKEWCRRHRHLKVAWKHQQLVLKLRGHYAYYGITGNLRALRRLRAEVERVWRKWLNRRSQRGGMTWERFAQLRERYPLPKPGSCTLTLGRSEAVDLKSRMPLLGTAGSVRDRGR